MKQTNKNSTSGFIQNIFQHAASHINRVVQNLNSSRLFAGCMIIVLNIGSKYVNIKLSKSVEAYLKYTFSKQVMVFAIAWMGTRDIYIALLIATLFTLFIEFLFNEESKYCCLTESFTDYHLGLLESENTKAEDKPVPVTTIDSTKKTDLSNSATQNNNPFTPLRIENAHGLPEGQLLRNNVTLPLESPPEGGDLNRQRCTNDKFGNVVEEHISIDEKTIIPNVKEISEMYESSLFYAPFSK